jgi:hypothetical protein
MEMEPHQALGSDSWGKKYHHIRQLKARRRQEKLDDLAQLNMDVDELEEKVRETRSGSSSTLVAAATAAVPRAYSAASYAAASSIFPSSYLR